MRPLSLPVCLLTLLFTLGAQAQEPARRDAWLDPHRDAAARLLAEAVSSRFAWERLAELGDTFGENTATAAGSTAPTACRRGALAG